MYKNLWQLPICPQTNEKQFVMTWHLPCLPKLDKLSNIVSILGRIFFSDWVYMCNLASITATIFEFATESASLSKPARNWNSGGNEYQITHIPPQSEKNNCLL